MPSFSVHSAYDDTHLRDIPYHSSKEAQNILDIAYKAHKKDQLPKYKRIEILEKLQLLMKSQRQELAITATKEGGKPLTDSLVEVDRAINGVAVAIHELFHMSGREIPMNLNAASKFHLGFTRRKPRGVVLAISAFNHPVNLIIHQVIPAIATGCPVLVKPSLITPLSCINLVQLLYEAGLEEKWCQILFTTNEDTEKIVQDKKISFLTFIGSSKVGWLLRNKMARSTHGTFEHGGAAPVIIDENALDQKGLQGIIKGGYYHAGQVCVSVQRVYVHKNNIDQLQKDMLKEIKKLKVGDPTQNDTEIGPLISKREVDRVHNWVEEAVADGAKLLCGGEKLSATCYAPTLLLNPSKFSQVTQKEIFGPVVCLYPYNELDDAITLANELDYSFQSSVFTKSLDVALMASEKLQAMTVLINDHTAFRVDWMPFGGHLDSGQGVGGIGPTMEDMTLEKLTIIKSEHV